VRFVVRTEMVLLVKLVIKVSETHATGMKESE
jgi:hypothetical protein